MLRNRQTKIHIWQYLLIVLLIVAISIVEILFKSVREGLVGTPLILVVLIASIYFDAIAGIISVSLGAIGLFLINFVAVGYQWRVLTVVIEFILAGVIIYYLAEKSRQLSYSNLNLEAGMKHMEGVAKKLKSQVNVNKKDLDKLNKINADLREVVDAIMEDQSIWSENVAKDIKDKETKRSS